MAPPSSEALRLVLLVAATARAIKFPNEVVGEPRVDCGHGEMLVSVETAAGNASRIFVKGHHELDGCHFQQTNEAVFPLNGCDMNRQRQVFPRGIAYQLTVIVQLHPYFITKVDRAYHVRCFYMEADKDVSTGYDVSALSTELLTASHAMPQCMYGLHKDSPNGPMINYATVGDKVWHVWDCPSDVYGMLVHSCFVDDGRGNGILIVDERGCAVDKFVMDTPVYSADLTRVQQETHVFKFADKITVAFKCQIRLCFANDDSCRGVSPPDCSPNAGTVDNIIQTTQTARGETTRAASSTAATEPSRVTTTETEASSTSTVVTTEGSTASTTERQPTTTTLDDLAIDDLIPVSTRRPTTTRARPSTSAFPTPPSLLPSTTTTEQPEVEGSGEAAAPTGSLEKPVDPRGRRNLPLPAALVQDELDVGQQLIVLEPDDTRRRSPPPRAPPLQQRGAVSAAGAERRQSPARDDAAAQSAQAVWEWQERRRQESLAKRVCLSAAAFALVLVSTGALLLVGAVAAVVLLLRLRAHRRHPASLVGYSNWSCSSRSVRSC